MNIRLLQGAAKRRRALEKDLKVDLKNIGYFSLNEAVASGRNCENMIGVAQIPLGIAGPILIEGKKHYVPLATTEGALVASINRGCKAISESGGAALDVKKIGVARGPVFKIRNLKEKRLLERFLEDNLSELKKIAKDSDNHLALNKFDTACAGRNFYARFVFDTDDAMGMNMATIAAKALAEFIEKKTGIKCLSISGNYCVDKKPAWLNFIDGRGFKVWAEVLLPKKVLRGVLKTSARDIYDVWLAKCLAGSALAGSLGFNAQFANTVAAIFLATGQDPAHITEGSLGITSTEIAGQDLYASVYLPDLMAGTVGGGTGLATQKESLAVMGIGGSSDGRDSLKLAKIIGGGVLAGEVSLLASLAQGSLVRAHQRLARGKKI